MKHNKKKVITILLTIAFTFIGLIFYFVVRKGGNPGGEIFIPLIPYFILYLIPNIYTSLEDAEEIPEEELVQHLSKFSK